MRTLVGLTMAMVLVAGATSAGADLVHFAGGRVLSVQAHRREGDRVVLLLHGGGEVVCDSRLIHRIEADEVPPATGWDDGSATGPPLPGGGEPGTPGDADAGVVDATRSEVEALVDRLARRHGLDAALVRAVVDVESGFRPWARSRRGAMGLMQLMPATARRYGVDDPWDPGANLDAGIRHLRWLLARFELPVALAAYNAGEAAVRRHGGVPPFAETRRYIDRVLRRAAEETGRLAPGGPAVAR